MVAVLFDLGNVLVRLAPERSLALLRRLAPDFDQDVAWLHGLPEVEAVARGTLDGPGFLSQMGERVGTGLSAAQIHAVWCHGFEAWPEMEALAEAVVAGGTPTYLVSNTDPLHFAHLSARIPVLGRLRGVHLSYEVGALKPEAAFYTRALERWALAPQDCLFLDDRPENVTAAAALGMRARVFDGDVEAARAFLREGGARL
jgi:putative hydrolase of the HAD superfamily